jgi:hypothetical protein
VAVSRREVTGLLRRWRDGDAEALAQLMPLVYDQLRRLARHYSTTRALGAGRGAAATRSASRSTVPRS